MTEEGALCQTRTGSDVRDCGLLEPSLNADLERGFRSREAEPRVGSAAREAGLPVGLEVELVKAVAAVTLFGWSNAMY